MNTSRIRPSVLGGLCAALAIAAASVSSAQAGAPVGPAGTAIDAALVGRHFKIYIPADREGERGPTYYYDADKERLTLTVDLASGHILAHDSSIEYLTFVQEATRGAAKLEADAFT